MRGIQSARRLALSAGAAGAFALIIAGLDAAHESPRPQTISVADAITQLRMRAARARGAPRAGAPSLILVARAEGMRGAPSAPAKSPTAGEPICALLRARLDHVGEAVTFRGEYLNDHRSPARVRPLGCEAAIVIEDAAPAAESSIERADPPPWPAPPRRIVATFAARLVQAGAEFSYDEGVRLSISGVSDLEVLRPAKAL